MSRDLPPGRALELEVLQLFRDDEAFDLQTPRMM
jgi:hypothetical protein